MSMTIIPLDLGFEEYDACYDPSDPIPAQGQFRSQVGEVVITSLLIPS